MILPINLYFISRFPCTYTYISKYSIQICTYFVRILVRISMSVFLYVYFSVRIYTYSVFARIGTYTRTEIRTNVLHHVHIYTYASNSMYVYSSSTSKCTYAYVMNVLTRIQYMNVSVHIPKMEYVQINYACTYLTILYF